MTKFSAIDSGGIMQKYTMSNTSGFSNEQVSYNTDEQNQEPQKIYLYPPQPLSREEFGDIVIRENISLMDDNEFVETFGKDRQEIDDPFTYIAQHQELSDNIVNQSNLLLANTMHKVLDLALDNRIADAQNILLNLSRFSEDDQRYISAVEGEKAPYELPKYIKSRFANIEEISAIIGFVESLEAAHTAANAETSGFTLYTAETINSEFENFELNLSEEQQAKMYYLASRLFRKANFVPGCYTEPAPGPGEIESLKKVLDKTSDIKLIACCRTNRFKAGTFDDKALIIAYKRALTNENHPYRRYKINTQIGDLYRERVKNNKVSFNRHNAEDIKNLRKAELYYITAKEEAPENEKLNALKKIAELQKLLGNKAKWAETKEEMAYSPQFTPTDRCQALISLAVAMQDEAGFVYMEKALKEIKKSKLKKGEKDRLFDLASESAQEMTRKEEILSSVNTSIANYKLTPNKQRVRRQTERE